MHSLRNDIQSMPTATRANRRGRVVLCAIELAGNKPADAPFGGELAE